MYKSKFTFHAGCSWTFVQNGKFSKNSARAHLAQYSSFLCDFDFTVCKERKIWFTHSYFFTSFTLTTSSKDYSSLTAIYFKSGIKPCGVVIWMKALWQNFCSDFFRDFFFFGHNKNANATTKARQTSWINLTIKLFIDLWLEKQWWDYIMLVLEKQHWLLIMKWVKEHYVVVRSTMWSLKLKVSDSSCPHCFLDTSWTRWVWRRL